MGMMTTKSWKYKWAQHGLGVIQSVTTVLLVHLLSLLLYCWHWTTTLASTCRQNSPLYYAVENYLRTIWNSICARITIMTVEIMPEPTLDLEPTADSFFCSKNQHSSLLPVLRLNSVTMDDYTSPEAVPAVPVDENDGFTNEHGNSSNYNSNSEDCDSGLVFTDPEENELSSDDALVDTVHNRIPQESYTNRRDSDSSDISTDGREVNEMENEAIVEKLIHQVESMFSDEYLAKDGFLLKHVRRRSDGFVSLKLVAGLRKVKQISREFPVVQESLRKSSKLEINSEGTKVRRIEPLTAYLKALPTTGNKDKESTGKICSNGASSDSALDDRMTSRNLQYHNQTNNYQKNRNQRNNSVVSTGSSNSSSNSRNSSFSKPSHEPIFRNMMVYNTPTPDEIPNANRRRGTSLPMPMILSAGGQQQYFSPPQTENIIRQKRNSMYLSPNVSPTDTSGFQQRPKSNSYCEGIERRNSNGGTSLWLQRRMASTRTSESSITLSSVVRQPRGPDGTKGFPIGYRQVISVM